MTFASRDAFPARGGMGDAPDPRFPIGGGKAAARAAAARRNGPAPYVELHAHSAYSFLDGASLPEELAARAAELGYDALALTDHAGVYGSLEVAHACKHFGLRSITGAEITVALDPGGASSKRGATGQAREGLQGGGRNSGAGSQRHVHLDRAHL